MQRGKKQWGCAFAYTGICMKSGMHMSVDTWIHVLCLTLQAYILFGCRS